MKSTHVLIVIACFVCSSALSAEKQLWAKSIAGQKGPDLVVEKWISEQPETAGKFVLIDFWATWCGPCRKAIPELNAFHKKYASRLVVIGISDEKEDKVRGFESPKMAYFSAIDTQARMKKELEVKGIPHVILMDPEGIVRWEGFPFLQGHELTEDVLEDVMARFADTSRQQPGTGKVQKPK